MAQAQQRGESLADANAHFKHAQSSVKYEFPVAYQRDETFKYLVRSFVQKNPLNRRSAADGFALDWVQRFYVRPRKGNHQHPLSRYSIWNGPINPHGPVYFTPAELAAQMQQELETDLNSSSAGFALGEIPTATLGLNAPPQHMNLNMTSATCGNHMLNMSLPGFNNPLANASGLSSNQLEEALKPTDATYLTANESAGDSANNLNNVSLNQSLDKRVQLNINVPPISTPPCYAGVPSSSVKTSGQHTLPGASTAPKFNTNGRLQTLAEDEAGERSGHLSAGDESDSPPAPIEPIDKTFSGKKENKTGSTSAADVEKAQDAANAAAAVSASIAKMRMGRSMSLSEREMAPLYPGSGVLVPSVENLYDSNVAEAGSSNGTNSGGAVAPGSTGVMAVKAPVGLADMHKSGSAKSINIDSHMKSSLSPQFEPAASPLQKPSNVVAKPVVVSQPVPVISPLQMPAGSPNQVMPGVNASVQPAVGRVDAPAMATRTQQRPAVGANLQMGFQTFQPQAVVKPFQAQPAKGGLLHFKPLNFNMPQPLNFSTSQKL